MNHTTDRGIIYPFICGTRHACVLAVSLYSLRRHWTGDVTLMVDAFTMPIAAQLAEASESHLQTMDVAYQKQHTGYANKPRIPSLSPYRKTIQLDADTAVVGPFDELWPVNDYETVLSPISNWKTTGKGMRGRLEKWRGRGGDIDLLVDRAQKTEYPALNTGVVGYGCDAALCTEEWLAMTMKNPRAFISDEIAMQLLLATDPPHTRVVDDRFNWSPLYGAAKRETVSVMHFHGKKHCRPEALIHWWPLFAECWQLNYGGIRAWCPAGDGRLAEYLAGHPL